MSNHKGVSLAETLAVYILVVLGAKIVHPENHHLAHIVEKQELSVGREGGPVIAILRVFGR